MKSLSEVNILCNNGKSYHLLSTICLPLHYLQELIQFLSLQPLCKVGTINIPISQMRKLRHKQSINVSLRI